MFSDPSTPDFNVGAMSGSGPAPLEPDAEQRKVATAFGGMFVAFQEAGFSRGEAFRLVGMQWHALLTMRSGE